MTIKYLPATPSNLGAICSIDIISYENPLDEEIIYDCIKLNQMIVVFDDKKLIGYICWQDIPNGKLILGLAIWPSYRRRGIATKLVQFLFYQFIGPKFRNIFSYFVKRNRKIIRQNGLKNTLPLVWFR